MAPIKTYVFLAMGTDGLPKDGAVEITKLSVIAMSRSKMLKKVDIEEPDSLDNLKELEELLQNTKKPVCLIAHNGLRFHYPVLKYNLEKLDISLPEDLLCADSLRAFYEITQNPEAFLNNFGKESEWSGSSASKIGVKTYTQLMKDPFFDPYPAPNRNFNVLEAVYEREIGDIQTNSVSDRCLKTAEVAVKHGPAFVAFIDHNHCAFAEVEIK